MIHTVKDTDTHFIIDGATRLVKNESEVKSMLVQFDHNSEQFSFKVPREFDNHDLSLCNTVRVHFINVDKSKRMESKGVSLITETLHICPDDDKYVICSWLIPREATQYAGILSFVIQFACFEGNSVLYSWNTAKYSGVTIAEGLNAGEEVVSDYVEILTQWENELKANQITKIEQTTFSTEDEGENIWTATFGDGRTQELKVRNGSKGSTGLIGSIETINGTPLHFYVGTREGYDALSDSEKENLFAIFTDDTEKETLLNAINALTESISSLEERLTNGELVPARAGLANFASKLSLASGTTGLMDGERIIPLEKNSVYLFEIPHKEPLSGITIWSACILRTGDSDSSVVRSSLDGYGDYLIYSGNTLKATSIDGVTKPGATLRFSTLAKIG